VITAILNGYNRPQNIPKQIEALRNQTIPPTEILLWYNQGSEPPFKVDSSIKAAYCNHNFKYHGRFAFALLAKTKYVALFDDDTIPGKKWFENCLNTSKTYPGILGSTGIVLLDAKYHPNKVIGWNSHKSNHTIEVDLVGHAWFMERKHLTYLWYEDPISWENGEDIQLSYLAQKYGGVRTFVPPHPVNQEDLWGSIQGRELGTDSFASYKLRGIEFTHERDEIVRKSVENGWGLVKDRLGRRKMFDPAKV